MNQVVIGVGSNINAPAHIEKARQLLAKKFKLLAESKFVPTKPVGPAPAQADFLNGAILLETPLDRSGLERELKQIEKFLGRRKSSAKFGPRTMDLDILVWNKKIVDRDVYDRDFLKRSVQELIPALEF